MNVYFNYVIMCSLLFENIQRLIMMNHKSRYLTHRSKFKYAMYSWLRFYKSNILSTCVFFLLSLFLISNDRILLYCFMYLMFSPILICYCNQIKDLILILFFPFITIYLKNPLLLFLYQWILSIYYSRKTETPNTFLKENKEFTTTFRLLTPFILFILLTIKKDTMILSQQTLVLTTFIIISNLERALTETKLLIDQSKSRYMIWFIRTDKFNLKFLNQDTRSNLLSQILFLSYLCILLMWINNDLLLPVMVFTCFIHMFLFEIDKLVQYHFFNKSLLYDDSLSRFVVNQIILSGISFYLIFLGINHILNVKHVDFNNMHVFQLLFLMWFVIWSVFFFKRLNKKFSHKILKFSLFTLLLLVGCTSQNSESYTVVDQSPVFYGNIESREIQTISTVNGPNDVIKVTNGDQVEAGQSLLVTSFPEATSESQRITYQISQLNENIKNAETKLKSEQDEFLKTQLIQDIESMKSEIDLLNFDKKLIRHSETYKADFPGLVLIEDNVIKVLSDDIVLKLTLNEHEYRSFRNHDRYSLMTLDNIELEECDQWIILPQLNYDAPQYNVILKISTKTTYPHQTILIKPSTHSMIIPQKFIRIDDDLLYIKTLETEVMVIGTFDALNESYLITEGITPGDVIYAYE